MKPLRQKTQDVLVKVTFSTYFLFMLGFFVIPNAVDQYKFYSVAVFIPALALVPRMLGAVGADRLFLAIVAYLLWMLSSSFWSASFDELDFIDTSRLVAYILIFILLTGYAARRNPALTERAMAFVSLTAALAAIVSVPLWYSKYPFSTTRIVGIGTLDNPNPSSFVYGFFAVLSLHLALGRETGSGRSLFIGAALVLSAFVVLTHSNTGILATFSSVALLLLPHQRGRLLHLGTGVLITGVTALFLAYSIGLLGDQMDSGFRDRIPIWETVVEQIQQAPLIGHGYQKELILNADGSPASSNYAHSALLASFRDGGVIALALHVLVLGLALVGALRSFRQARDPAFFAYLLFGFVCMLADTDQLITRPRELWVIFWWPLAVIIADRSKRRATPAPSGNQPGE